MDELTPKQAVVLNLVKQGLTIRAIAVQRGVSEQAIYAMVKELIHKGLVRRSSTPNYVVV